MLCGGPSFCSCINAKSEHTPLHEAMLNGDIPMVEALIAAGDDIHDTDTVCIHFFLMIKDNAFILCIFLMLTNRVTCANDTRMGPQPLTRPPMT